MRWIKPDELFKADNTSREWYRALLSIYVALSIDKKWDMIFDYFTHK